MPDCMAMWRPLWPLVKTDESERLEFHQAWLLVIRSKIGLHCLSKERFNPLNQAILIRKSNIMTRPWAPVHGQAATACQIKLLALQIQERPQVRIASQDQYSA